MIDVDAGGPPSDAKKNLSDGTDAQFLKLTKTANAAFESRDEATARRLYQDALVEAERLFDLAEAGGSPLLAPMAYTIACHNAAEANKQAGDQAASDRLKRRAAEKLVDTAASVACPLALRVNCVRHLRHAFAFMAEDLVDEKAEGRAALETLIARSRMIQDELARVTAHVLSERQWGKVASGPSRRDGLN